MKRFLILSVSVALLVASPSVAFAFSPASPGGFASANFSADIRSSSCATGSICMSKSTGSTDTTCGVQCWSTKFDTTTPIPWAGLNNSPTTVRAWSGGTFVYSIGKQVRNRDQAARTACFYSLVSYNPSPGAYTSRTYNAAWLTIGWSGFGSWAVIPNAVGWNC